MGAALLPIVATMSSVASAADQNVCAGVSPVSNSNLTRVTVASGMTAGTSDPLFVTAPPGDVDRIFIVLQNGVIRQLPRGAGETAHTVFMDIDARVGSTGDEQGLLGLAFSPKFATDGFFTVNYTRNHGATIISRFRTLDGTPNTNGDPASETILLRIALPSSNHNGGWMSFGPDGFLYIAQGDGGGGGDVHGVCGNGQERAALLGKLLRVDPTGTVGPVPDCGLDAGPYTVPPGNPLADGPGTGNCDEVWAYGLRNPWRNSFDPQNGDLYIGDVGQGCWEEVDWTPGTSTGGENYGWRLFEGRHCYNSLQGCSATSSPAGCTPACSDPAPVGDPIANGTRLPIWDYSSSVGSECTVVGGYVYRGCRMPNFRGKYFYGDYCAGTVLSFQQSGGHRDEPPKLDGPTRGELGLRPDQFRHRRAGRTVHDGPRRPGVHGAPSVAGLRGLGRRRGGSTLAQQGRRLDLGGLAVLQQTSDQRVPGLPRERGGRCVQRGRDLRVRDDEHGPRLARRRRPDEPEPGRDVRVRRLGAKRRRRKDEPRRHTGADAGDRRLPVS